MQGRESQLLAFVWGQFWDRGPKRKAGARCREVGSKNFLAKSFSLPCLSRVTGSKRYTVPVRKDTLPPEH